MGSAVLVRAETFVATAYGPPWGGIQGGGTTSTGINLHDGKRRYIIAADPSVLPTHAQVYIWPNPYNYSGPFQVEDTGGAIKGRRIDFYVAEGRAAQSRWGSRSVKVSTNASVTQGGATTPAKFDPWEFLFGAPKKKGDKPPGPLDIPGTDPPAAVKGLENLIPGLVELIGHMLDPAWWLNVFKVVAGGILVIYGLNSLSKTSFGFNPAAKVGKAAATVAVVK